MRKIGFMPCKGSEKEILPKSYRIDGRRKQRMMFFSMLNEYLPMEARVATEKPALFEQSILQIFNDRIFSFFQCYRLRPERAQRVVRIYAQESLLFGQYFNCSPHPKARYFANAIAYRGGFRMLLGYQHPASQLIQLIFDGKEIRLMLDLDTLFAQTVYRRIKREPSKRITLDAPYIHIDQHGVRTRIYPRWKQVDPKRLERRQNNIENGFSQLNDEEIDQHYLIYPKTEVFRRHIQLKNTQTDQLKMIPYSFTFCLKERKTCRQ